MTPRLIDYIVFVGCKRPTRKGLAIRQPELLRMYPPTSYKNFNLPPDIAYFCQPEGCYSTTSKSFMLETQMNGQPVEAIKTEFFTFTLTDKESNSTRFGICLNFLRPIPRRKLARPLKKRVNGSKCSTRLSSQDPPESSSSESSGSSFDRPERPFTRTLTSICLVSHYQFCKKFEYCLYFLYTLIQKLHEGCKPRFSGR